MITMVSRRMKSSAPVSLVTTTATNESSPELTNSAAERPPRRDRRMEALPLDDSRLSDPDGFCAVRPGIGPLVEQLLDDVPVQGVALLHAHVEQLEGIL